MKCEFSPTHGSLRVSCSDHTGIVADIAAFFARRQISIIDIVQHSSLDTERFYMRLEFSMPSDHEAPESLQQAFAQEVVQSHALEATFAFEQQPQKVALLVSKYDHALLEILWRYARCELKCQIACVISNHNDLEEEVQRFALPFYHIPSVPGHKAEQEAQVRAVLREHQVETIVLARYMQILSADFVQAYPQKIINIHHSFLPAFVGARPYQQAYERGVKLIGATAHYVTAELDQGPIIEQDVVRVSHRYSGRQLQSLGADVERAVLVRALSWHLENRIVVEGNKTLILS